MTSSKFRGDIPGHYFDAEKEKYFKIQPNHIAPPNSKYSIQKIAQKKIDEKRKSEDEAIAKRIRSEKVTRISPNSFAYLALQRETSPNLPDAHARLYGRGLGLGLRVHTIHNGDPVKTMAYDKAYDTLILAHSSHLAHIPIQRSQKPAYCTFRQDFESPIHHLALTPNRTAITMTYDQIRGARINFERYAGSPLEGTWVDPIRQELVLDHSVNAFHSCSADPIDRRNQDLSIVTWDNKASLYIRSEGSWMAASTRHFDSDVLATAYTSDEFAVLGLRNGDIHLWTVSENPRARTLCHPSSINSIRTIGEHTLVVAGIDGQMAMYDLRMDRVQKGKISKPVVKFQHRNRATRGLGIDVHARHRVLAATNEDNVVEIFSLNSGRCINRLHPLAGQGMANNLLFVEDDLFSNRGKMVWKSDWSLEALSHQA